MFITIEGGEGVGKSTYIKQLELALKNEAWVDSLLVTREPGGTDIGKRLREIFISPPQQESLTIEAEFMIVSAARAQHVKHLITPQLERGGVVLCDRFADSSRAYQGILGGLPADFIERVVDKTTFGVAPTLTVLLDCPVDISMQRLQKRNQADDIEGAKRYDDATRSTHKKLRQAFLQIAKDFPERFLVQDAQLPTAENVKACIEKIAGIRGCFA